MLLHRAFCCSIHHAENDLSDKSNKMYVNGTDGFMIHLRRGKI